MFWSCFLLTIEIILSSSVLCQVFAVDDPTRVVLKTQIVDLVVPKGFSVSLTGLVWIFSLTQLHQRLFGPLFEKKPNTRLKPGISWRYFICSLCQRTVHQSFNHFLGLENVRLCFKMTLISPFFLMQRFVKNLWIKVKISLFDFKPSVLLYKVKLESKNVWA